MNPGRRSLLKQKVLNCGSPIMGNSMSALVKTSRKAYTVIITPRLTDFVDHNSLSRYVRNITAETGTITSVSNKLKNESVSSLLCGTVGSIDFNKNLKQSIATKWANQINNLAAHHSNCCTYR